MKIKTKPNDLVLEIGSGDNPRVQSTILLDRYIISNNQRAGKFSMLVDRPLVVGNGYCLPFADKQFDYVICSHVLEHLEDPISFAKELMRVGKKGYIEVPNIFGERLFGWSFHLWYCEIKKGALVMTKKKEGEQYGEFFHRLIANHIWFRRFFEKYENVFYIQFVWNNNFNILVNRKEYSQGYLKNEDEKLWKLMKNCDKSLFEDIMFYYKWLYRRILRKIKKTAKKSLWKLQILSKQDMNLTYLIPLLRCINCTSTLIQEDKKLICVKCHRRYIVDDGIPIMLKEEDRKKGY